MISKTGATLGTVGIVGVICVIIAFMTFGINNNGYRTVVQLPSGTTFVKFEPGIYFDWFGRSTVYPDVLTYDFTQDSDNAVGVDVRYQDGGLGAVHGIARFDLPATEEDMLELHRAFRTQEGVRDRLIRPVMNEGLNLTAGLMTSEEAYAERRNEYLEWSNDQVSNGKYLTRQERRTTIVEPEELDAEGNVIKEAVERVQNIPVPRVGTDGNFMRGESPLGEYFVTVSGFQIEDWTFEQATLDQIQQKREANMAIITSQANAARANQERLQAIAEGERNVAEAQYEQEVEKARQVVIAEREAEVAAINAEKFVEVNRQNYLAQQQDVLASEQEAIARLNRANAEAEARELLIEADGALAQKLETYENVMKVAFTEFAKVKWAPDVVMGGSSGTGEGATSAGNPTGIATDFMTLLTAKTAQDLQLDMSINAGRTRGGDVTRRVANN